VIDFGQITAMLLCAGLSRRFGSRDKLLEPLAGVPLVDHAARAVASLPFAHRVAVVPPDQSQLRRLVEQRGFSITVNHRPEDGREQSLRLGLAAVMKGEPEAVKICLGDMPHVSPAHFRALADRGDDDTPAVSLGTGWCSPPVLFPKRFFAALLVSRLRELLAGCPNVALVRAPPGTLDDFDTPGDFERAAADAR